MISINRAGFRGLFVIAVVSVLSACGATSSTTQNDSSKPTVKPTSDHAVKSDRWALAGYRNSTTPPSAHSAYRPLKRVLVTLAPPQVLDQLKKVAPGVEFVAVAGVAPDASVSGEFDAIMVVCAAPQALAFANQAAWVHSYSAGVEGCLAHDALRQAMATNQPPIITNSSGTAASVIGEHAIAMTMSLARGLHIFRDRQSDGVWSRRLVDQSSITSTVAGKTMLVLGLGAIGKEVAIRANALGMKVMATRNSSREGPSYIDYVGLSNETLELAAQADVVVNALPLTESTKGMLDAEFFATMKQSALLISVGRGGTTNTDDLLAALESKQIAGAGLDVTDPEPLPKDHPLWQQENVIITPHLAGTGGNARPKVFALMLENLRRYQADEPLLNIVNAQAGY